jgi:GAF domain-containing protein
VSQGARGEDAAAVHGRLLDGIASLGASLRAERSEGGVLARLRADLQALGVVSALLRAEEGHTRLLWVTAPEELHRALQARAGAPPEKVPGPPSAFARRVLEDGAAFIDDWAAHAAARMPASVADDVRGLFRQGGFGPSIGVRIDAQAGLYLVLAAPGLWKEDVAALRLFGAQISAALEAARTIADLSRRNAHLSALARVAELAGDATDLPTFFARASEAVRSVAGYVACAVYVIDEAAGSFVRVHVDPNVPPSLEEAGRTLPLGSLLGEVVRQRIPRAVAVPWEGGTPKILAVMPYASAAWVPLVARSRCVGAITVGFDGPVEEAQRSLELLSSVGAHFASAIESHGLLADLRRRVDEATLLLDVARATAEIDPALLLDGALARLARTIEADVAAAWLREGDHHLALASSFGMGEACAAALGELGAGEGAPGLAVERRAAVRVPAPEAFGGRALPPRCPASGHALAVPLLAKAQPVGALLLARRAPRPFGDAEAALLSSIGAQLGVAVDAARLFADVRRRLEDLEAVNALTLRVFSTAPGDTRALFQDACRELVRVLGAQAAAVLVTSGSGAAVTFGAEVGLAPPMSELSFDLTKGITAEVIRTGKLVQSSDDTLDPRSQLFGRGDLPPLSVLAMPLVSRRDVRGVIFVADRPGRRFGEGEIAVANALASALGLGLENAELYADAQRRVEELSALNEAARAIAGSLDLADVLRQASEAARRLVGASRAWVLLRDAATGELRVAEGAGIEPRARGEVVAVEPGSMIEGLVRTRQAAVAEDVGPSTIGAQVRTLLAGRALAAVPVQLRGELLGVLGTDEVDGPRRFTEDDLRRLTALADRLAVAIENARLYQETRRRAEQLGVLHEVGRSLAQSLDIGQVLDDGVRNLARIVDAPGAHLWLLGDDGASLTCRTVSGTDDGMLGVTLPAEPPDHNLASRVIASREPLLVERAAGDARILPKLQALSGGKAYLSLPLVVRDRAIGAVVIFDTRGPRVFTPSEVERAAAVANQLAVAVENARLYEDLRRSYAQLARAQQQLVQGERLAALGELSAVVAHEVRNPLGVIFNSLGPLRRLVRPSGDAKMLFDIVEEEAERLNRIVGDLLDFARPSTPELRPEHLGRVAEDAVAAAVPPLGAIEVIRELDPALPQVPLDARLVRQAVLNLAVNAVQAMPRGGRIVVRARLDGDAAVVEVEDDGPGIPAEVRERIFEPFFTTKASGTGLGLAVVRRIVEGHGGEIRVRTAPGAGTTFALRFPLERPG